VAEVWVTVGGQEGVEAVAPAAFCFLDPRDARARRAQRKEGAQHIL
jgi:hypothetical protein